MAASRWSRYALTAWLGILVFALYGRALAFPFFSDDFFQLPFLDNHRFGELWQTAEGLFFFRPLAFSLWKVWFWLLGVYQTAAFHALNLLLHWLNGVLVAWLTARLWPGQGRWLRGAVAATLFALFPFSYEAVAWVAAVMHPFFLALTLLSVGCYLQMWRSKRPFVWLAAGLLLALLSPFAHENGVLTGPLVWAIALTRPQGGRLSRREMGAVALWALPIFFWFLVWQGVPARDGSSGLALNEPGTIGQNGLYFLQGPAYPTAWYGGHVREIWSLDPVGAVLAAALPALLVLLWARRRLGFSRQALLPWVWIGVAAAPAVLFLPNLHVIAAPRMFMLPAVGIAWLWTEALWYFYQGQVKAASTSSLARIRYRYRQEAVILMLGLLLWQNVTFIRSQLDLYEVGGRAIAEAAAAAQQADEAGRGAVFINLPSWIAPLEATYALGQEGDNLILGADMIEPMIWSQTGRRVAATAVRYDDIRVKMPYYTGPVGEGPDWLALAGTETAVFAADYQPDGIGVRPAGRLGVADGSREPLAVFGESVRLLEGTAERRGEEILLHLTWEVVAPTPFEWTVFVHGVDGSGALISQADGDPLVGTFAFGLWPAGTIVQDTRIVPAGQTERFLVGLYNRVDGTRVAAVSTAGEGFADDAVPID